MHKVQDQLNRADLNHACGAAKLALGTVQFGLRYGIANQNGQVSRPEAKAMLELARAAHIETLDTAIAYGESEACLGEVGTEGFSVVTKLPALPAHCLDVAAWVSQQASQSMERLGCTAVHGLLLHRSGDLLGPEGAALFRALEVLKERGQVHKIGVSIYSPGELEALSARYRLDLVQAPFNLVDRRLYKTGWLQRLKDDGVEVHTRSVFLQGLLLMRQADLPTKFTPWGDLWRRWHQWLSGHSISAVQACLAYPLAIPEIDRIVVGADGLSQLEQIVRATNVQAKSAIPDLECQDERLINPALWSNL